MCFGLESQSVCMCVSVHMLCGLLQEFQCSRIRQTHIGTAAHSACTRV